MKQYRLFFFSEAGRLTLVHEFRADDDARATKIAEGWQEGRRMELWSGEKMIRAWRPETS